MSTPRWPAGFFYKVWKSGTRWRRLFSKSEHEVKYSQDFRCEFTQPAVRFFTVEMLDKQYDQAAANWRLGLGLPLMGSPVVSRFFGAPGRGQPLPAADLRECGPVPGTGDRRRYRLARCDARRNCGRKCLCCGLPVPARMFGSYFARRRMATCASCGGC